MPYHPVSACTLHTCKHTLTHTRANAGIARYQQPCLWPHVRAVHPCLQGVLLVWNAHMNLQRVTNASWSRYLLKYAMKVGTSAVYQTHTRT